MINLSSILKKDKLSIFFIFLPNILRWMPFRTFPLTIQIGTFPFFWPSVFYLFYILMTPKRMFNREQIIIKNIINIFFILCPFVLLFNEGGKYALELWLQDIIFFLVLFSFFVHTPSNNQINSVKWLVIGLYFYILVQMIVSCLGIYQFDESDKIQDGMMFIRGGTKVGDSNQTSAVLFVLTSIITGFYSQHIKFNFIVIVLTIVAIAMGATRSGLIVSTLYFVIYLIILMRGRSFKQKIGPIVLASVLLAIVVQFNVFADVLFRQQELQVSGNFSSNRTELMKSVINKSMTDSPIFGVGQGRVYPSTDEIARHVDVSKVSYSKYTGAPHNVWVLALCEYGVFGIFLILIATMQLVKQLKFSTQIAWSVMLVLFVLFNTEAILIHDQSFVLICFLIIVSIRKKQQLQIKLR